MAEFSSLPFNFFSSSESLFLQQQRMDEPGVDLAPKPNDPPPPPPIVICPTEVDHINITLEKNQQCECKDCGKLFNSVWYLKQHAVKHSNDRPFKCKFCFKTYKFRSNLYQHKCPDRQKHMGQGRRGILNLPASARRLETNQLLKSRIEANMTAEELAAYQCGSASDNEENDIPITYGLIIQRFDENPSMPTQASHQQQQNLMMIMKQEAPRCESPRPQNCVREHQLPEHEIENYILENKSKLHTCRKCRLLFPTATSLMRHSAAHSREDMFPYKCNNCRQAFESDRDLRRHSQVHAGIGPWRCEQCSGVFRSSPALRRHRDQCRQCHLPTEQGEHMLVSVHSPIDPFSFIPSESDLLYAPSDEKNKSPDSGVGSHGSPERTSITLDERYEMFDKKKEKEDDEDSGFRSRLNSVTQTCSPGSSSAFSSDGGSPLRKISGDGVLDSFSSSAIGAYGTGPSYGHQLFDQIQSSDDFFGEANRVPSSLPVP